MKPIVLATFWLILLVGESTPTTGKVSSGFGVKGPTTKNQVKEGSPCKKNEECPRGMNCHDRLEICVKYVQVPVAIPTLSSHSLRCTSHINCTKNMYCHKHFKLCLPIPVQPTMATEKKRYSCKSDQDCGRNQYCHRFFKICYDVLAIPTVATRTSSARKCKTKLQCRQNEYCHPKFKLCLENRSSLWTPKPTTEKIDCMNDQDCQTDEYCHNMSRLCLQLRKGTVDTKTRSGSGYRCTSDDDCKITEFCRFLFSDHRHVARDPSRPVVCHGNKCVKVIRRSRNVYGICIPKDMKMITTQRKHYKSNCTVDKDCEDGMCCLRTLGVCLRKPLTHQVCVSEKTIFSCPCYGDFVCVSKGKRWKRKKIERKMKLDQEVRKRIARYVKKGKKFSVGKCE